MSATSPDCNGGSARRSIAVATVVAIAIAACGGDDDAGSPPDSTVGVEVTAAPVTTVPTTTVPVTTVPTTTVPITTGPTTTVPATTVPERADRSIFDYEPVRPVEYEVVSTQDFRGVEMQRIKFESPLGGLAYGYLSLPVGEPAVGAAVLWAHGAPSDGKDNYPPMSIFACAGATSIVVDAPYARPGANRSGEAFLFTSQDRDEQIQLIVDMRRALDLLADLGGERFGFGGISYGSAMGGLLLGVDDRITAAVLLLGNGGVVERFTDESGAPSWPLTDRTDEEVQAWIEAMLPIEPIRFIGDSTADLLFMSGDKDPLIPPAEAERFYAAAPQGAEMYWMDEAHDIPFEDMFLHNRFIGDRIGIEPERLDTCTSELFPNGWDDL
jgi:pimeloyl-ACP methyl ester carboxylesterase